MTIKQQRALSQFGPRTADRIGRNIPEALWRSLTSRELALVARLVEAAYLDGYTAAGGDVADTVRHEEAHRQRLVNLIAK